jgi:hypothetical protein
VSDRQYTLTNTTSRLLLVMLSARNHWYTNTVDPLLNLPLILVTDGPRTSGPTFVPTQWNTPVPPSPFAHHRTFAISQSSLQLWDATTPSSRQLAKGIRNARNVINSQLRSTVGCGSYKLTTPSNSPASALPSNQPTRHATAPYRACSVARKARGC